MSLNLSVRPRRRRWPRPIFGLVGAVLLIAGLIAWSRGWRPADLLATLEQPPIRQSVLSGRTLSAFQPQQTNSAPVALVDRTVVENPQSKAYTAALYSGEAEEISWPNVNGRTTLETYTVQEGDTLWSIAVDFGLTLDTLRWSNPELERNPDVLAVGTELRILPVNGVYHLVGEGDTIESIAAKYGVAETDIADYPPNGLYPPYDLTAGEGLIVPFGRKDLRPAKTPALSSEYPLAWPVIGYITGGFEPGHRALDIGLPYGSTVYAADDGTIIYADWATDGYGYTVVIDHGDGRQTWYNHLKGTLLKAGGFVSRGTPIAETGSTGHSTGPHLHFEVRIDGEQVNPLDYLPGEPQ